MSANELAKELQDLENFLKAYENDLSEHMRRCADEDFEGKERELDKKIADMKDLLRKMNENRENLMTHLEAVVKPDLIKTEARLKTLANNDEMKLNVRFACVIFGI